MVCSKHGGWRDSFNAAGLVWRLSVGCALEANVLSVLKRGCKVALITACSWNKLIIAKEGIAGCQGHSHEIVPMCESPSLGFNNYV